MTGRRCTFPSALDYNVGQLKRKELVQQTTQVFLSDQVIVSVKCNVRAYCICIRSRDERRNVNTHLRCSTLGRIHWCGTLTVFGKPVVPDVCSTYANSLFLPSSDTVIASLRSALCSASRLQSLTSCRLTCMMVSLNLGNTM